MHGQPHIILQFNFRKIRCIRVTIPWDISFNIYTSRCTCLCAATFLSLCSRFGRLYFMLKCFYTFLCSVVLLRNYFHNSEQESRKFSFVFYQTAVRPHYLCLFFWIIIFNRTKDFPQFSQNQVPPPPIHHKIISCDTLKMKIIKFIFNGRLYEFYFLWIFSLNLVLWIVPFPPFPL